MRTSVDIENHGILLRGVEVQRLDKAVVVVVLAVGALNRTDSDGGVVVTYGGKDGDDTAAYRAFILNYNIFAVTVKYDGVEYTIEPYGYQIINY